MKRLVLLGASGSIGMQTIDVYRQHPEDFSITALGVGHNIPKLKEILSLVPVKTVCVQEKKDAALLAEEYPDIVSCMAMKECVNWLAGGL
jgi:1-deoxy-D-xylulose-5-phosphate reductoisomerase